MIKEELVVAVNTIDAGMLKTMFLAGAKNLEVKKGVDQRTQRLSRSGWRYRHQYDADDYVRCERG